MRVRVRVCFCFCVCFLGGRTQALVIATGIVAAAAAAGWAAAMRYSGARDLDELVAWAR